MELFTLEDVNEKDEKELMEHMVETLLNKKEFEMDTKGIDDSLFSKERIKIDDLREYYTFDHANRTYIFPFADERMSELYKNRTFIKHKFLPGRGFFWLIQTKKIELPFGLLKTQTEILKINPKENDRRWENSSKHDFEEREFYYNYGDKRYYLVNRKSKKGDSSIAEIYDYRMNLYTTALSRLEKKQVEYADLLQNALTWILSFKSSKSHDFIDYLTKVKAFILTIEGYLPLKIIFPQTSLENYNRIKKFLQTLKSDIDFFLTRLKEFEKRHGEKDFLDVIRDDKAYKLYNDLSDFLDKKVKIMFNYKGSELKISKHLKQAGYFGFDKKELFENLTQIELNHHFAHPDDKGSSTLRRKEEERILLESLQGDENAARNSEEPFDPFTKEERERIASFPKGVRRTNEAQKLVDEKAKKGIIKPELKLHYMGELT